MKELTVVCDDSDIVQVLEELDALLLEVPKHLIDSLFHPVYRALKAIRLETERDFTRGATEIRASFKVPDLLRKLVAALRAGDFVFLIGKETEHSAL